MSKQIDKLTKEQEAKIPAYLEKYMKIGLSNERCDRAKAEDAIRRLYKQMEYGDIKHFYWLDNPLAGCELAAQFAKKEMLDYQGNALQAAQAFPVTRAELAEQASKASYGSFEAYWVAFYDFVQSELPVPPHPLVDICKDIVLDCGVFWTFKEHVIITEKPKKVRVKDNKLHSVDDLPAIEYYDGTCIYAEEGKVYSSLMEMKMAEKTGA
jgi:hypothetical protein